MFVLDKPKSTEPVYIFFSMYIAGVRVRKSTGQIVRPGDFENERTPDKSVNSILTKIQQFVETAERDAKYTGRHLTPDMVVEFIDKTRGKESKVRHVTFQAACREIIDDMEAGRIVTPSGKRYERDTIKQYNVVLGNLNEFGIKSFDKITLNDYHLFIAHCNAKSMSINTIGNHIKRWKRLMGLALQKGYHANMVHRHEEFKIIGEQSKKISFDDAEIEALEKVRLWGTIDVARDWFIIDCHTGLRVSDLVLLNDINIVEGFILIPNEKTDEVVMIPIHPKVQKVLDKYGGFPPKMAHQTINEKIKLAAREAGITGIVLKTITKGGKRKDEYVPKWTLVTNHTARRSLITNARKMNLNDNLLMKITGIKDIKTLQKYDKITPEEAAKLASEHEFFKE